MATKNGNHHRKSLTQPERSFWRDVFIALAPDKAVEHIDEGNDAAVSATADFADKAVAEYRKRITWRDR